MITCYSRRMSDYLYDIEIDETTCVLHAQRFCARAVNIVRLESGHTVSVDTDLSSVFSSTRHEAVSKIEAALAVWVKAQKDRADGTT
jgi:hypothetical protein